MAHVVSGIGAKPTLERARHIQNADGLRALAVCCVAFTHILPSGLYFGTYINTNVLGSWGVDCFFVLSGFLISRPFFKAFLAGSSLPSTTKFFRRRFFRIYPTYVVAVILCTLGSTDLPYIWTFVWSHLLFLHGFMISQVIAINGPLWTLSLEVQFYLCMPFLMQALAKATAKPGTRSGVLIALFAALVFISLAWRALAIAWWHVEPAPGVDKLAFAILTLRTFLGTVGCYACGMAIAFAELSGLTPSKARSQQLLWSAVLIFIGYAVTFTQFGDSVPVLVLYDIAGSASAALFFYATLNGIWPAWARLVATRQVAMVAALSYSFYLVHYRIFNIVNKHLPATSNHILNVALVGVITLIISFILADMLHRFVETPFLKLQKSKSDRAILAGQVLTNDLTNLPVRSPSESGDPLPNRSASGSRETRV